MWRYLSVNVGDLLFSVSEAMDLADPSLTDHQLRTACIAWQMARHANMYASDLDALFVAAMLHDIGALSPEEKLGIHTFEDLLPEPHCVRGEKLFEEAFWLAPSAPVERWHQTHSSVDVATAMAEKRPYRDHCAQDLVLGTLGDMVDAGLLDRQVVTALGDNDAEIMGAASEAQAADPYRYLTRYAAVG